MIKFVHMKETEKLKAMLARNEETITSLAGKIGITRTTLYTRLKKSNWKKSELLSIRIL